MTRLTDHRRFALATALVVTVSSLVLCALFALLGRPHAVAGVAAGAAIALLDIALMVRGLDRLQSRGGGGVGARALTVVTLMRFALIGVLVGMVLALRGLDPIGVVVGFLLMPAAILAVGINALRSDPTANVDGGLDGHAAR
jgi:ATP synthase I subunit